MQFSVAAVLAFAAAGVSAHAFNNGTQTYVTEVVTAYTTFCPVATEITAGGKTYTVTSATTLTITDCASGCTVTKPVYTSKVVDCKTCNGTAAVPPPAVPTKTGSVPVVPVPVGTGSATVSKPPSVPTAAADKLALSGAALAGIVGFAALL
ncbi:hypothetical protein MCOR27_004156 [Pyricularia oryzae]|uniref:Clock-controlled protein 6 n=5 Tax=Pyricularia TaxID=48558 RepID=A0ABQ8NRF1_PYRGI|nr:uncharacterized protein MGG_00737 [Pyricularia oryzae 70-15]ELQ36084.1 hypothetical protein OOU_Y34scaffold00669g69 [Pyricularia oryzae Y34]KAH8840650.1 hypothetical protein MCOR01_007346 [Pyricularia oryzae]KAI6300999.1 hypothetical protein MCOR33_003345 [Pyricularia grisea]EHA48680.1 hypothetical protein MGG_00737 [Pyricularia oryzae 70-15]KAH9434052.1 hypothetical protein MCOR02_006081 [Pyricularia oryzae]